MDFGGFIGEKAANSGGSGSVSNYKGSWNASTNIPTLVNGTGSLGDYYNVTVAGSVDFGAGSISFDVTDDVAYNGTIWYKKDNTKNASEINTDGILIPVNLAAAQDVSVKENIQRLAGSKINLADGSFNIFSNKASLVDADIIAGEDSANSFSKIHISLLNLFSFIKNKFKFNKTYYVSAVGNDSNNGYTPETAFLTLGAALTAAGNSGNQVCVFPGTYAENITITNQNVTITSSNYETGGLVNFTGTFTVNHASSSIRLVGLTINTLNHTGAGSLYLDRCSITSAFSSSGSGYLYMKNSDTQGPSLIGTVSLTGTGSKNIVGDNTVGFVTIDNLSISVNISNNLVCAPVVLSAGTLGIGRQVVYSASGVGNAITVTGATSMIVMESITTLTPTNTPARINIAAASFYSIRNCAIDNTNSTLLGTNLQQMSSFDAVKAIGNITSDSSTISGLAASQLVATDASKNLQTLNIATYPSLTEISYGKGVISPIQSQLNSKQNTITGAASSVVTSNLTANRVLISDGSGKITNDTNVTTTELALLDGLNSKPVTYSDYGVVNADGTKASGSAFSSVKNSTGNYTISSISTGGIQRQVVVNPLTDGDNLITTQALGAGTSFVVESRDAPTLDPQDVAFQFTVIRIN